MLCSERRSSSESAKHARETKKYMLSCPGKILANSLAITCMKKFPNDVLAIMMAKPVSLCSAGRISAAKAHTTGDPVKCTATGPVMIIKAAQIHKDVSEGPRKRTGQ